VNFSKKKSTEITQEAYRTLNITVSRLLPALTTILFEMFKDCYEKYECLSSRGWGTFLSSAVITLLLSYS
jgi:hypothetical protein